MGGVSMYERIVEIIKSNTGLSPTAFLVILTLFIITYNFVSSFFFVHVHDSKSTTHVESQQLEQREAAVQVVQDMKQEAEVQDMKREAAGQDMKREAAVQVVQDMKQEAEVQDMKREAAGQDMKREAAVQVGPITPQQLESYDGSDPKKPLLMAIKGQIYDVSGGRMFYGPGGPYSLFSGRDATRALALMSFDPQDLTSNTDGLTDDDLDVLRDWELKFSDKYPKVGTLLLDAHKLHHLDSKKFV